MAIICKRRIIVRHLAYSDTEGGAARAVFRIHSAINRTSDRSNLSSTMRVILKKSDDMTVTGGSPKILGLPTRPIVSAANKAIRRTIASNYPSNCSFNWPRTGMARELNSQFRHGKMDFLQLNWIGYNTISIEEIGELDMPIFWRLADQWAFLGGEHYTRFPDLQSGQETDFRYKLGYSRTSRPHVESGFDFNRLNWIRKKRSWKRPVNLICPSQWMLNSVTESELFANYSSTVIATPMDLQKWKPMGKAGARFRLGISQDEKIVAFVAPNGLNNPRKGGDFLLEALRIVNQSLSQRNEKKATLVIAGQGKKGKLEVSNFPILSLGFVESDSVLRDLYAASDIVAVPSIQDNLPGTALEAQSCGRPVIAFRVGGLPEILEEGRTGFLIKPFVVDSLASKLIEVLDQPDKLNQMGTDARRRAAQLWDSEKIALQYNDYYREILRL